MSASIVEFSGKLWLRDVVVWCVFGLAVGLAAEAEADPADEARHGASTSFGTVAALRLVKPDETRADSSIQVRLTLLDLAGLDIEAFGDHHHPQEQAPGR